MNKKCYFFLFFITTLFFMIGCGPLRYNVVHLNPTPNPVYNKKGFLISLSSGYLEKSLPLNFEIQKFIDKENDIDGGFQTFYSQHTEETFYSYNLFGFLRQWLRLKNRQNPWGSVYGGLQIGYGLDERERALYNNYIYTHLDIGLLVGLYRKNFTLVLGPRVGVGGSYPHNSIYIFFGPVIQSRLFLIKNLGLGFDICYVFGSDSKADIVVIPQLYKWFVLWRF
ncbi:MAG: hypothetical protein ABDH23_05605 [Endomicrobiia bacterium]